MSQATPIAQPRARASAVRGRAAVFAQPRRIELEEIEFPAPGPGHVRVRLQGCGLCGSNLPIWEGRPWFEYPREAGSPGHEGWGFVDAVGEGVTDIAVGDRVACLTYKAFADYDYAAADALVRLPESLANVPFPAEPLACAANVFARSGLTKGEVKAGDVTVVVGIGFLGALLVQYAAAAGSRVIAVSRRPFALEIARRCGAETVLASDDPKTVETIYGLTNGAGCDRAIECVGNQEALDLASSIVRVRGRLVIAGYHQDGLRQVNLQQWNWRGIDVINAHERDPAIYVDGMRRALRDVADGTIDPSSLYTHEFPLERLGEAFAFAESRPDGFLKALIRMDGAGSDAS
jgi:threonine dehydrogenase-like Zn-dependent dehydrogenase